MFVLEVFAPPTPEVIWKCPHRPEYMDGRSILGIVRDDQPREQVREYKTCILVLQIRLCWLFTYLITVLLLAI